MVSVRKRYLDLPGAIKVATHWIGIWVPMINIPHPGCHFRFRRYQDKVCWPHRLLGRQPFHPHIKTHLSFHVRMSNSPIKLFHNFLPSGMKRNPCQAARRKASHQRNFFLPDSLTSELRLFAFTIIENSLLRSGFPRGRQSFDPRPAGTRITFPPLSPPLVMDKVKMESFHANAGTLFHATLDVQSFFNETRYSTRSTNSSVESLA